MSWGNSFAELQKQKEPALETLAINNVPLTQDGLTAVDLTKIENYKLSDPFPLEGEKLKPSIAMQKTIANIDICSEYKFERVLPSKANRPPTHDPYTNPNAQLYYSCGCGAIFDPGTKRFAELNNHASNAGWKIRFSDRGYTPYCVKCGEGVE